MEGVQQAITSPIETGRFEFDTWTHWKTFSTLLALVWLLTEESSGDDEEVATEWFAFKFAENNVHLNPQILGNIWEISRLDSTWALYVCTSRLYFSFTFLTLLAFTRAMTREDSKQRSLRHRSVWKQQSTSETLKSFEFKESLREIYGSVRAQSSLETVQRRTALTESARQTHGFSVLQSKNVLSFSKLSKFSGSPLAYHFAHY